MITLLIVGVVLSYGIPNLAEFTANSRITSTSNDLHAAFQMARSESARAKANITICASADPLAADSNCDGTWDQGYIVFVDDTVGDDLNRAGGTETVLRAHGPIAEGVTLATLPTTQPISATPPLDSGGATLAATRRSARSSFATTAAQLKHQQIFRQHACL